MADREDGEQRELVAVHALAKLIALCENVDRAQRVVVDLDREESLERTHQSAVPGVDDEAGSAGGELSRLIRLDELVADLREPWWQNPVRRVVEGRIVGTTIAPAIATTIAISSTPSIAIAIHRRATEIAIPGPRIKTKSCRQRSLSQNGTDL